jgi:hypothetical protein
VSGWGQPHEAINKLPEKLIDLGHEIHMRSVFYPSASGRLWRGDDITVVLHPGEHVVNVESVLPNPSIGAGTRVWIAKP